MKEQQNTQLVRKAYEAFSRGDIPHVLTFLDDRIEWEPLLGAGPQVPMAGKRQGKQDVTEFFRILSDNVNFDRFEPREFIAQGDQVVTLGHYDGHAKPLGRTFSADWAMVFTIRDGRIVRFREYVATSVIEAAFEEIGV